MPTNFAVPVNNASTTVGSSGYTAGSGSLVLATGGGAFFPSLASGKFFRVTVAKASSAYSPSLSASNYTIFKVTGVSGDTLTLSGTLEGTTDRNYVAGDVVEARITAGSLADIHAAINALEGGGGGGSDSPLVPAMTSNSAPSPFVASGSDTFTQFYYAFDGSTSTYWGDVPSQFFPTCILQIDLGSSKTCTSYQIVSPENTLNRSPKDWTMDGSADASTWTTIDTRSGVTWSSLLQTQTFTVSAPASYRYYRLNVTNNQVNWSSDGILEVVEFVPIGH